MLIDGTRNSIGRQYYNTASDENVYKFDKSSRQYATLAIHAKEGVIIREDKSNADTTQAGESQEKTSNMSKSVKAIGKFSPS